MKTPYLARRSFKNNSIYYFRRKSALTTKLHWHDYYEFEVLVNGRGQNYINGRTYDIESGSCYFLSSNDVHKLDVRQNESCDLITVQFLDGFVGDGYINKILNSSDCAVKLDEKDLMAMVDIFEIIDRETQSGNENPLVVSRLFESMLEIYLHRLALKEQDEKYPSHIQRAIIYIQTHFSENPTLSDVAKEVFLNKNYFCALFGRCVGKSYKEYLKSVKLEHAARLLCATDLAVTDVASRSGYGSISNFNRDFKGYFGTSPVKMRRLPAQKSKTE